MILKMEKLSAFGLLGDKDAVISALMRKQCVQLKPPETLDCYEELGELTRRCDTDVYAREQQRGRYAAALSGISPYTGKTGMFAKFPRVSYDGLEDSELTGKAEALCGRIEAELANISDCRGAKNKDQFLRASMEPWVGANIPLELGETKSTVIIHYLLPAKTDMRLLEKRRAETAPNSHLERSGEDREQQYIVAFCYKPEEDALWEILKEFGAAKAAFPGITGTPGENIAACDKRISLQDAAILESEQNLRILGADLYPLKYAYDALGVGIQQGKAAGDFLSTREAFCFTGWVPESTKGEVTAILDRYGCYYEFQECGEEEEAPILLKNSKLITPYETITQMYSLPAYHGFDPNGFIGPFFFLFFGMMLSDAGYGLLLIIGGLLLLSKKDFAPGGGKLIKVLVMGGISTVIWGAVFGSWFGDIVTVVAATFFNRDVVIPKLLDPLTQPMTVMIMSFIFGAIHLFVGMGIKAYLMVKRGHPWQALFDVGFWYMVLIGLPMLLGGGMIAQIGKVLAIAGAAGLILTQGRDAKNPFMKLINGVMSLYDITGYFSDVLSYSRILALGLATGVIASVVNIMGSLTGSGFIGAIVLIVVFVFGHMLNFAINALGSYVHTSRLQYVEFFGKFYEAGGKPFVPLAANTKYIRVLDKEENQ